MSAVVLGCLVATDLVTPVFANHQAPAVIEQALKGAAPERAKGGTVLEQEGDFLQEGDNGWTRMPPLEHLQETLPMCNAGVRMEEWADAGILGVCYMLAGDEAGSKINPHADEGSG